MGLLEAVFVQLVLHLGRQTVVPQGAEPATNYSAPASRGELTRWAQMDDVDLTECMLRRIPMFKTCLRFMRGRLRQCWAVALRERGRAKQVGDVVGEVRAWKLFCLVPMMLLHRPRGEGSVGRDELAQRAEDFEAGKWVDLVSASLAFRVTGKHFVDRTEEEEQKRRGVAVQNRVQRGQVSRAREELTGAALAPKNAETLAELRRQRPQAQIKEIPPEVMEFQPAAPLNLDPKIFHHCLSGAPSGVAPGPGGCTNEMLRVCLDDIETTQLLFRAVEDLARGEVPEAASRPLMLATMTALEKKNGRVRGIATGTSFRRLAAKTLARQFSQNVEEACAPFQFALSTRAGTDCVGHAIIRAATEADPKVDSVVHRRHRGIRPRASERYVVKTVGGAVSSQFVAVCQSCKRTTKFVRVGGRGWCAAQHRTT